MPSICLNAYIISKRDLFRMYPTLYIRDIKLGHQESSHNFMNRYFLVVTPGLEKLLYKEICEYVPRLRTSQTKAFFTTGGIEMKCTDC